MGFDASSAPTTKSSRWKRRIRAERSDSPWAVNSTRAMPSAATASSTAPYASVRGSALETRPPYRRPVVPSSPLPVATALAAIDGRRLVLKRRRLPDEPGVARVPTLRQKSHLDFVLDDRLDLLFDLLNHRTGVRAERRGQNHLDLGLLWRLDDLLDQRELDHVHADLWIHDGAKGVEDRELGRPCLRVKSGRCCRGCVSRRWLLRRNLICHVGYRS